MASSFLKAVTPRFAREIFFFIPRAQRINCNNAEYPDQYGHYREAKFTMTKHHWWWKVVCT